MKSEQGKLSICMETESAVILTQLILGGKTYMEAAVSVRVFSTELAALEKEFPINLTELPQDGAGWHRIVCAHNGPMRPSRRWRLRERISTLLRSKPDIENAGRRLDGEHQWTYEFKLKSETERTKGT